MSTGKPGKRYNARMTGYVWFLCLIGGSGGLLLGYDNGIIGKSYRLLFTVAESLAQELRFFQTVLTMCRCYRAPLRTTVVSAC